MGRVALKAYYVNRVENHVTLDEGSAGDDDIASALNAYVERAMNIPSGSVVVTYGDGVASLTGCVTSVSQGQAIEDLVRWHDRVSSVVNDLRTPASAAM